MRRLRLIAAALAALTAGASLSPAAAAPPPVATTPAGTTFVPPEGWASAPLPNGLVYTAPEGDSRLAVLEMAAPDADSAVAAAWKLLEPGFARRLRVAAPEALRNGLDAARAYSYEVPPNERRAVFAGAYRHGDTWAVVLFDGAQATLGKRSSAINTAFDSLAAKGYVKENFAGRTPHKLDPARVAALRDFVAQSMEKLGIPGAGFALVEDGRILYEGGLGVREVGKPARVDAHTLFLIASNTKSMSTLLLAQLVDEGKLRWDEPVVEAYPAFRLADPQVTRAVQIRHLVCACTGMPRQDLEWIMRSDLTRPASDVFRILAASKPTSGFGEMYQYSNSLAAAAGYVAGHIIHPDMELGAAFDRAIQERVFDPLGMRDTTFDFHRALARNHASPHNDLRDLKPAAGSVWDSASIWFMRPAGGAWSSAHDMIRYVRNELSEGLLPNGRRIVSAENLLRRRERGVSTGEAITYGMGLENDETWGVRIVHHGGAMPGYKTDMIFIPEAKVGAVILTNADNGRAIEHPVMRRLVEILYDGHPEAASEVDASAAALRASKAERWSRLVTPPDPAAAARLAAAYANPDVGRIDVRRSGADVVFDFGIWHSRMATRRNDDGTISFATVDPTAQGFEFVLKPGTTHDSLVLREAQHEYVYAPLD